MRAPLLALAAGALAVVLAACAGTARPPAPTGAGLVEVARFGDARALAADPAGRLYVVDAAEAAVVVLDTAGARLRVLGGAGAGDYAFLEPADVDPTNGLELFVADAGNGRIQRFSSDGRLLESVAVPLDVPRAGTPLPPDAPRGRPAAIAAGTAGTLYAADPARHVVLVWQGAGRRPDAFGWARGGPTALAFPVGLDARADGTLAVADSGRAEAVVYDAVGRIVRAVPGPGGARAVAWAEGSADGPRLLVTGPRAVSTFADDGRALGTRPFDLGRETLVDAVEAAGRLWLLTPTRLLRADG